LEGGKGKGKLNLGARKEKKSAKKRGRGRTTIHLGCAGEREKVEGGIRVSGESLKRKKKRAFRHTFKVILKGKGGGVAPAYTFLNRREGKGFFETEKKGRKLRWTTDDNRRAEEGGYPLSILGEGKGGGKERGNICGNMKRKRMNVFATKKKEREDIFVERGGKRCPI